MSLQSLLTARSKNLNNLKRTGTTYHSAHVAARCYTASEFECNGKTANSFLRCSFLAGRLAWLACTCTNVSSN